jgi:hypothetical protein
LVCAGDLLLKQSGFSTYKGMRKPEFQKSGRIEATNLSGEHFGRSEFSGDPGSVNVSCRRMSPVNMVFLFLSLLAAPKL